MAEIHTTWDARSALAQRIFRLRYRIYVEEMGLPLAGPDATESLHDPYDDYSVHFLMTAGGEDVGTLRLTFGDQGKLELEQQNAVWAEAVAAVRARGEVVAEITRLMLTSRARGGAALPR